MREAPTGSRLLLDARRTDYVDPDVLSLIREFKDVTAPAHGIQVHLLGFAVNTCMTTWWKQWTLHPRNCAIS